MIDAALMFRLGCAATPTLMLLKSWLRCILPSVLRLQPVVEVLVSWRSSLSPAPVGSDGALAIQIQSAYCSSHLLL